MEKYSFIIALVIILGVCGAGFIFAFLKKKGIKVDTVLEDAKEVVEDAGVVIQAGKSLSSNPIFNKLDLIDRLAQEAVGTAQQLYISSQLPAEQRKEKAKEIMSQGFKEANIKETPELDNLVDMAIEYAVYNSKSDAEKTGQQQNALAQQNTVLQNQIAQLNAEKAQLQAQITELTNKNTELNDKLTAVKSTVIQAAQQ